MNEDILKLIEQGRQQFEEDLLIKAETAEKERQEQMKSWAEYTGLLRNCLPVILAPCMLSLPLVGPEFSRPYSMAPKKINGYEHVRIEIPELAPIQVEIHADGNNYYQLPGILGFDKPQFLFGNHASGYYNEERLPVVLYKALELMEEFDDAMDKYERQCAELNAIQAAATEYVPVEGGQTVSPEKVLLDALKTMVLELVGEAMNGQSN